MELPDFLNGTQASTGQKESLIIVDKKAKYQSPDSAIYSLKIRSRLLTGSDGSDNGEMHNGGFLDE